MYSKKRKYQNLIKCMSSKILKTRIKKGKCVFRERNAQLKNPNSIKEKFYCKV